jgi:hypothetical protein
LFHCLTGVLQVAHKCVTGYYVQMIHQFVAAEGSVHTQPVFLF